MKNKTLKNKPDKPKSLTKLVFSIIAKTVMAVFFILGFLIISVSVIAPGVMAPTYDALGLNKATYLIYKRVYNREATKENLYNLIQLSIENKEYEDQVTYIKQMLDDEEFVEFAEEIDEATKKTLGKRYSIYADSYESYLRKHIVIALYSTGRELEAKMMAIDSVYGSVDELYVYVNLVVNDTNLIEMQKESELQTLYSRYGIINASGETDPLMLKKKELDEKIGMTDSVYNKIICIDQKIKLEEIRYYIAKYAKDDIMEEKAEANIKSWQAEREQLLKQL